MPSDPQSFLIHLPWLLALALAIAVAFVLWQNGVRLRKRLDEEQRAHELTRSEQAATQQRVITAEAESQRLREDFTARSSDLKQQVESLNAAASASNDKLIALESNNAALNARAARVPELSAELEAARKRLDDTAGAHARLESDFAALKTQAHEQQQAAADKIKLLEQAEVRLTREFENLANRIFDEKQKKFSETSQAGVEAMLTPVRQQLLDFRRKVEDIYDNENKDRASLRVEISQLKSLNERISSDALNLTNALKGDSKARGNWGEIQLERLLEQSGLVKGREYEVQGSFKSEHGQRFQPDIVIHLPDNKDVIVDSKVSLVAYEAYHAATEDSAREAASARHIQSLRTHIDGLSGKSYDELLGLNSLDLVIMFVPIEPALLLAYEHRPTLHEEAFGKNILLVSPSNLMLALKVIHNIWRNEYQKRNTQQIADDGGKLYDQFVNFVDSLDKVGNALNKARDEFETAHKRLTSGRGNLVGRAEKLRELGIKTKKALPAELLDEARPNDTHDNPAQLEDKGVGDN